MEIHPKLGIRVIDHLFNRLDGLYPRSFKSQFADENSIKNWQEAWIVEFEQAGLTPADVRNGIARLATLYPDWPPTCGQFLVACKPPINVDAALYEAMDQIRKRQTASDVWSNPKIFWAAVAVGEFDMLNQPFSALRTRFAAALAVASDKEIPPRLIALPAVGKTKTDAETGKKLASNLLKSMRDCKPLNFQWAQKIIERAERGEHVNICTMNFAREALAKLSDREEEAA